MNQIIAKIIGFITEPWVIIFLKWLFSGIILALCVFNITLILLQRGEEGAFRKALTTSTSSDSFHMLTKTIWGCIFSIICTLILNKILFYTFSKGI